MKPLPYWPYFTNLTLDVNRPERQTVRDTASKGKHPFAGVFPKSIVK
jgi:hypothetical protein